MKTGLTDLTLPELEKEKDRLIMKYIGEVYKGLWYYERLEHINSLIDELYAKSPKP